MFVFIYMVDIRKVFFILKKMFSYYSVDINVLFLTFIIY
ncbi:hypothetical protein CoNPh15_CDS0077 [Staphylococcus phage S-CoN_Ph15]|nr:hypothetical protein CoNPh14_CDS0094 [Staphylococcus phage S-CoN_Ph14]WNM53923.1 hypothetical protein CoNPh15_CDS0077 [Staphylococcus phage S-CoN_Ph15]WNM54118.1 hypothetical protein CoNPh16_CDS0103 [Staphylococcus phage S-CoN_Ph16]